MNNIQDFCTYLEVKIKCKVTYNIDELQRRITFYIKLKELDFSLTYKIDYYKFFHFISYTDLYILIKTCLDNELKYYIYK